jgi:hypothetical protein
MFGVCDSAVNQKENLFQFYEQLSGLMQSVEWSSEYFLQHLTAGHFRDLSM